MINQADEVKYLLANATHIEEFISELTRLKAINESIKPHETGDVVQKKDQLKQAVINKEQYYSKIMATREEIYTLMETFNNMITLINEKMLYYDMLVTKAEENKGKK